MPLYVYSCPVCGTRTEALRAVEVRDMALDCPSSTCRGRFTRVQMDRVITAPARVWHPTHTHAAAGE